MSLFINPAETIKVSDENGNTVEIKAKMDLGTEARVMVEFHKLAEGTVDPPIRAYELAFFKNMIVAWSGPDFIRETDDGPMPIPVSDAMIEHIDPNNQLWQKVMDAINEAAREETGRPKDSKDKKVGRRTSRAKRKAK